MPQFQLPGQTAFYKGKVRDVYTINNDYLVLYASDRISAFDVILPKRIPFKGQVLNGVAGYMLKATKDICPNWLLGIPTSNISIGYKCDPFKIEVVVRGNLCGHAWRTYNNGKRFLCGALLPDGLNENDFFLQPIITPSTKESEGHDEDISVTQILENGLATEAEWNEIEKYALSLFEKGVEIAAQRGLILADTKYEFGKREGKIMLMDEIHTPDSSRYFYADGFEERQQKNEKQKQLSKEFVREWLLENEFSGGERQKVPDMTDEWVQVIAARYIELYEIVTGTKFIPEDLPDNETEKKIINSLKNVGAL